MPNTENHNWKRSDDILTYIIFRFDTNGTRFNKERAADVIGTTHGGLLYRLGNFLAVETDGAQGAGHYAKLTERVFEEFADMDEIAVASRITEQPLLEFYMRSVISTN